MFQSTPPRRGRQMLPWPTPTATCFNPRPRAGGDGHKNHAKQEGVVSIHAPAQGATITAQQLAQPLVVSIHAPAQGATITAQQLAQPLVVSIHAPAQGATAPPLLLLPAGPSFNPRPRAGGDKAIAPIAGG